MVKLMSRALLLLLSLSLLITTPMAARWLNLHPAQNIDFHPFVPSGCEIQPANRLVSNSNLSDQSWRWGYVCGDYGIELEILRFNTQNYGKEATASTNLSYHRTGREELKRIGNRMLMAVEQGGEYRFVEEWFFVGSQMTHSVVETKLHEIWHMLRFRNAAVSKVTLVAWSPEYSLGNHQVDKVLAVARKALLDKYAAET
jgi:hypothetical protein